MDVSRCPWNHLGARGCCLWLCGSLGGRLLGKLIASIRKIQHVHIGHSAIAVVIPSRVKLWLGLLGCLPLLGRLWRCLRSCLSDSRRILPPPLGIAANRI